MNKPETFYLNPTTHSPVVAPNGNTCGVGFSGRGKGTGGFVFKVIRLEESNKCCDGVNQESGAVDSML